MAQQLKIPNDFESNLIITTLILVLAHAYSHLL